MWKPVFNSTRLMKQTTAVCLFSISINVSFAKDTSGGMPTINLHEAVTKTLSGNPELLALDYQLQAQEGKILQAGFAPSPELSIELEDAFGSGDYNRFDNAQTTISIAWVLERGVRQRYIDVAHAGSTFITSEGEVKRLDSAAETARRYLVSLAFQTRKANAEKNVNLAQKTIQAVRKRVKAGKTPEAELLRAKVELARSKLELEDIEHELVSANRRLAAQWGATTPEFEHVEGDILSLPALESFETLKKQLQNNPEFTRLLSDQRLKQAELQLVKAQSRPSWRVKAGVRHIESTNDQALVAGISIPFGKGTRNTGRIAEANANLEKIQLQEDATRVRLETTLFVLYEKLQHSLHVISTLRRKIIPPLEQALIETRRAYNLGRYSYLEWRSVQAELLDANDALIEASIDAHRNIIEIERLTGVRIAQSTKES